MEKSKEFIKPVCAKDHLWGNGKDVNFFDKCAKCGGDVVGFKMRRVMKFDKAVEIYGSWGLITPIKKKNGKARKH